MEELSKGELICMMEAYKDKYELAVEERDEEILRTLNQHDEMLDLQDKMDQREMFTKAAIKQLKEVTKERDNLKHQLEKLTEKKKSSENVLVKRVEAVESVEPVVVSEEYKEEAEALLQRSEQLLKSQHRLQQIRQELDMLEEMNSKYQVIPPIKSSSNESVEVQVPLSAIYSSTFDNTPLPTLRKRSSKISPPPARYGRAKSFVEPIKKSNPAPDSYVSFDNAPLPTLCKPPVSPPVPALQQRKSLFKPNKDVGLVEPVQSCMNPFKVLPPVAEKPSSSTAAAFFVSFDDTPLPKVPMSPASPPPARLSRPKSFFVPIQDEGPVEPVQSCMNPFKTLSHVAGKPSLPPVSRRRASVKVTKPADCRRSSVQGMSPVVRRRSSVRAMSPAVRRRSSVRAIPSVDSSAVRSAESNGHFVLPGIGEQSLF